MRWLALEHLLGESWFASAGKYEKQSTMPHTAADSGKNAAPAAAQEIADEADDQERRDARGTPSAAAMIGRVPCDHR